MTTDDDKRVPDPDPWAELDVGGADGNADEMTFAFEDFTEPAAAEPPVEAAADADAVEEPVASDTEEVAGLAAQATPREVPLAVFPPADAGDGDGDLDHVPAAFGEADVEREPAEKPPVIAFSAEEPPVPDAETSASPWDAVLAEGDDTDVPGVADGSDGDGFDDRLLAQELAEMPDDADAAAPSDAADFGDPDADSGAAAEDVSFDTVAGGATSPFADHGGESSFGQMEGADDAFPVATGQGDEAEHGGDAVASIPLATAVTAAAGQVAAGAARPKKKSGGLGTALGVAGGGLLALPVTYAILLWGLQKDPFKLGRHLPQSILPAAVRAGAKPARKPTAAPVLDAAKSLDALPLPDAPPAEAARPAADEAPAPAEPSTAVAEDAGDDGGDSKPGMATTAAAPEPAAPTAADASSAAPAVEPAPAAVEPATVAVAVPPPSIAPPSDLVPLPDIAPPAGLSTPAEPGVPAADPAATVADTAMPKEDALASLDALVAKPAVEPPVAPPIEPLPPLDVTAVDDATAIVTDALDAVEAHPSDDEAGRDRLLVDWYRRLAALGEEMVRLQTAAYDTGRPVEATPASAAGVLDRIATSERSITDLGTLGGMWINSAKRRADGVSLVVEVVATRAVGPYWSTKVLVAGGNADGSTRELSVISRAAPPVDAAAGRMLVTGVLFDGGAVWAADIRPVDASDPVASDPVASDTGASDTGASDQGASDQGGVTAPGRENNPVEVPPAATPETPETPETGEVAPAAAGGTS